MNDPNNKTCYVTWSGGIDSTGVLGLLLQAGWTVQPITLKFGKLSYQSREAAARSALSARFEMIYPDLWNPTKEFDGSFLNHFSADGIEITRRNKHILDWMMMNHVLPNGGYYLGMGEYIGADTWAVKDHVGAHDADARYLAAYLLYEYGLSFRLMTLADFGESRYKADRVNLLVNAIGPDAALLTTNCMGANEELIHCGQCYKCIERHAAFEIVLGRGMDDTDYLTDPREAPHFEQYEKQMAGEAIDLKWQDVNVTEEHT